MNTGLHALADAHGRLLSFFMTASQISDYAGAAVLLGDLPKVQWMPVKHDKRGYTRRNRIEIMFGRLKDWRRVAT